MPTTIGEHAVGGEQSLHVVTVSGWSSSSGCGSSGRERELLAEPAPPDQHREGAEEPPLDRVEEVADRGEPAGVGELDQVGGGQPGDAVLGDRRTRRTGPGRRAARGRRSAAAGVRRRSGRRRRRRSPRAAATSRPARRCPPAAPARWSGRPPSRGRRAAPAGPGRRSRAGSPSSSRPGRRCSRPLTKTVPVASQSPSSVTGWPTDRPGNGSSGPITLLSATGSARVRSRASSARRVCHASSCQTPQQRRGGDEHQRQQVPQPQARGEDGGHGGQRTAARSRILVRPLDLVTNCRACWGHGVPVRHPPLRPRRGLRPGAGRGGGRRHRGRGVPAERAPARRGARGLPARGPRGAAADGRDPAGRGAPRRGDDRARLPALRGHGPAPPAAGTPRQARRLGRAQRAGGPARDRSRGRRAGRGPWRPGAGGHPDRDPRPAGRHRRRRRAAAARAGVLGPGRRRRRLDGVPADVQQPARRLRARARGAGAADGRGGRPGGRLPGAHRRARRRRSRDRAGRCRPGAPAGDREPAGARWPRSPPYPTRTED